MAKGAVALRSKGVVTLYIDDTSIRLLVAKGARVEKWAHLPLEPGLVSDGAIVDEAKVAAKIEELLKDSGVKTKKVIAGLSGLHCLTRPITLPKVPKAVLHEAVMREAERIMPLPLEQLYISWQVIPVPGEGIQVFLMALPRNVADALVKTLRQAGVEPYLIDIAPLALIRVASKATAIIADVQPARLDVIIMVDGIPQPVRTMSLPTTALTLSEKLPALKAELTRTIKFYNSNHPEKPLDPDTPIFCSGELAQEPEACQSLASELKYPVLPLSSPLEGPEELAQDQYIVNIGLALKELSLPKAEANLSLVNLNALPDVYKPTPISLTKTVILPGMIIIAIGLLVPLFMRVQDAAADTVSLRDELNNIGQLIEQRQAQRQEIAGLQTEVERVEASRGIFSAAVDYIEDRRYIVNGDLEAATSALPDTIDLGEVSHTGEGLTISGAAPSETEILAYAKELRATGRFSEVIISSILRTDGEMDFGLTLNPEE